LVKGELTRMAMTDPIADMLTRIRNGKLRRLDAVDIPVSKIKMEVAILLKREGYIRNFKVSRDGAKGTIRVYLRYLSNKENVINGIERVSKPGRRVYVGKDELPRVKGGFGVAILTTPKGVMTDRQCREEHVGGEVLCKVW
jgi:small subunit ribosomal protein S8